MSPLRAFASSPGLVTYLLGVRAWHLALLVPWWALLGLAAVGCASLAPRAAHSPEEALALSVSLAGAALNAASDASDAAVKVDYRERLDACAKRPPAEHEACKADARSASLSAVEARNAKLKDAVRWQNDARSLLLAVKSCADAACADGKRKEAAALLNDVATTLTELRGAP